MHRWAEAGRRCGLGMTLLLVLTAGAARAESERGASDLPVDQIESIVRDYLLREPKIIYQALEELQRRQTEAAAARQREAIISNRSSLLEQPTTPIAGNPDGDVSLVEFFDYQCTYCRRVVSSMQALLEEDRNLRIVFKEFPILGEDSVRAARAALAAARQDRYLPFHFALMRARDLSLDGIMRVAEQVQLDTEQLARDMDAPEITAEIQANFQLARQLGVEGTPAFVVGETLVPGAVEKTRLVQLIEEARANCLTC